MDLQADEDPDGAGYDLGVLCLAGQVPIYSGLARSGGTISERVQGGYTGTKVCVSNQAPGCLSRFQRRV